MAVVSPMQTPATISAYASSLEQQGKRIMAGAPGTFWAQYESYAMMRIPDFSLSPPSSDEVERVLWGGRVAVATYLRCPDATHPANSWLYLCKEDSYRVERLSVAGRRDARRAHRNLRLEFIEWPIVFNHGFTAYSDSRRRVGLSDGTRAHFQNRIQRFSSNRSHTAVGAWKEDVLTAFMALIVVDDWVAIEGSFSTDNHRTLCPNDGLANFVLHHFLAERGFKTVTYGLSSIQELNQSGGLHAYKKKVGFEAMPVHRVFTLHPFLRPLANHAALGGINLVKYWFPGNRLFKKASGMLTALLCRDELPETSARVSNE